MELLAIEQQDTAIAQKDGKVLNAKKGYALTINTGNTAKIPVNVSLKTPNFAIPMMAPVFVTQDGVAQRAIVHVNSLNTGINVPLPVTAKITLSAFQRMELVSVQ